MINNSHRNTEKSKSETPVSMICFIFDTPEYTGRYSGECMNSYLDSKNIKHFQKGFCLVAFCLFVVFF